MDTIRVLRIIEYVGPRDAVEAQLRNSLYGERAGTRGPVSGGTCTIRATTLGEFPEIMGPYVVPVEPETDEEECR